MSSYASANARAAAAFVKAMHELRPVFDPPPPWWKREAVRRWKRDRNIARLERDLFDRPTRSEQSLKGTGVNGLMPVGQEADDRNG